MSIEVADLELCCELYKLSGWDKDIEDWWTEMGRAGFGGVAPMYDLGYLLRKLPNNENQRTDLMRYKNKWEAYLWGDSPFNKLGANNMIVVARGVDESPEDAVAKLAIELFKQGILTK